MSSWGSKRDKQNQNVPAPEPTEPPKPLHEQLAIKVQQEVCDLSAAEGHPAGCPVREAVGTSVPLTEAGAITLCTALRNPDVGALCTQLNLSGNVLGDEGATRLSEAMRVSVHLQHVELYGNSIGDRGARALAGVLPNNRRLRMLGLSNNNIGDGGAAALVAGLVQNVYLTALNLRDNPITDAGTERLCDGLEPNTTLLVLGVSREEGDTRDPASPYERLDGLLARNQRHGEQLPERIEAYQRLCAAAAVAQSAGSIKRDALSRAPPDLSEAAAASVLAVAAAIEEALRLRRRRPRPATIVRFGHQGWAWRNTQARAERVQAARALEREKRSSVEVPVAGRWVATDAWLGVNEPSAKGGWVGERADVRADGVWAIGGGSGTATRALLTKRSPVFERGAAAEIDFNCRGGRLRGLYMMEKGGSLLLARAEAVDGARPECFEHAEGVSVTRFEKEQVRES